MIPIWIVASSLHVASLCAPLGHASIAVRMAAPVVMCDAGKPQKESSELARLQLGWSDLVNGRAFDGSQVSRLATPEDFIGVVAHIPLIAESLRTAFTGQFSTTGYALCAASTLVTALAHLKMMLDTPRDFKAPRLAEYRSVSRSQPPIWSRSPGCSGGSQRPSRKSWRRRTRS